MHHPTDKIAHTTAFVTPVIGRHSVKKVPHQERVQYGTKQLESVDKIQATKTLASSSFLTSEVFFITAAIKTSEAKIIWE